MALIDLEELKEVLGIGDIYADAIVQEVADAAEDLILSYLIFNDASITSAKLSDNIAYFYTANKHSFNVGDSIVITGCGTPFNGTRTVGAVSPYSFQAAITNADVDIKVFKPWGKSIVAGTATSWDTDPRCREAALAIAADIWVSRQGQLGQQGIDFQPAPYRLGRSMLSRIQGLIVHAQSPNSMVG